MLAHLVYLSTRKSICSQAEIEKILASCIKNNPAQDITGCLVYSQNKIIQYLEGESKDVFGLLDKINLDKRNENVLMESYSAKREECFLVST